MVYLDKAVMVLVVDLLVAMVLLVQADQVVHLVISHKMEITVMAVPTVEVATVDLVTAELLTVLMAL